MRNLLLHETRKVTGGSDIDSGSRDYEAIFVQGASTAATTAVCTYFTGAPTFCSGVGAVAGQSFTDFYFDSLKPSIQSYSEYYPYSLEYNTNFHW